MGLKQIGRLINDYKAYIYMEDPYTIRIKCGEDSWKLASDADRNVVLLHNNYVMNNKNEHYITDGYHVQKAPGKQTAVEALLYLENYTWEKHLSTK